MEDIIEHIMTRTLPWIKLLQHKRAIHCCIKTSEIQRKEIADSQITVTLLKARELMLCSSMSVTSKVSNVAD